jgi:maleate cis-trans isomerase
LIAPLASRKNQDLIIMRLSKAMLHSCAYGLARMVDREDAEAVFLSGTGMPTLPVLELPEQDLGKPVISSGSAMMWHALRLAGVGQPIPGYGRLLTLN